MANGCVRRTRQTHHLCEPHALCERCVKTTHVAPPLHSARAMKGARIDPKDLPPLEPATLARIVGYLAPYWRRAGGVGACIVAAAALNLAPPWFVKRIVDVAIPRGDLALLWLCCAGMIAGPLLAGLVQVAQKYDAERIGQQVMLDLRVALYRHLHEMPFAFFAKQKPGEAVSHVLNDVQGIGGVVSGTLVDILQNTIVLLSTMAFVIALDWRLAILAVGFLPLFIAPARRAGRRKKVLKQRVQAGMSELTGMLTETLSVSGALLVKLCGGAEAEVRRFRITAEELKRLSLEQSLLGRWFQMVLRLFESVGPAIAFALGGSLVIRGRLPIGTVIAFVALLKRLYNPASEPGVTAREPCRRNAGHVSLPHDRPREPAVRHGLGIAGGGRGCREAHRDPRHDRRAARRLRHRGRRTGLSLLGRRAAAVGARAGDCERSPHPHPRRGNELARLGLRAPRAGIARAAACGTHQPDHHAPPLHHPRRRPHHRAGPGAHRRAWDARPASHTAGTLRLALAVAGTAGGASRDLRVPGSPPRQGRPSSDGVRSARARPAGRRRRGAIEAAAKKSRLW